MEECLALTLAILTIFVASRVRKFYAGLKAVSGLPGPRVPFWPIGLPGAVIPTTWWNPGLGYHWVKRLKLYKHFGSEVIAIVPFLIGPPGIYVSNVDVARQILGGGQSALAFNKMRSSKSVLGLWGSSLLYSDGDVWRKHRRVVGPAFHNTLYTEVWIRTAQAYHEMVAAEGWGEGDIVEIPIAQTITMKLTMLIIGQCVFGFPFTWISPARLSDGSMSIQECISLIADRIFALRILPKWAQKLPFRALQDIYHARDELTRFMNEQVAERKAALSGFSEGSKELRKDAFSMLVAANEAESEKRKLTDDEVVGNVFAMLFAGHETTGYALAATLGCVSLHQDIQDGVIQQIEEVVGYNRDPTIDDYPKLTKVASIFLEAVRLFPVGHIVHHGGKTVAIRQGTKVIIDMVGLQYNPRYFDEPEKFKPTRWEGISGDSEAFTAFSFGPRTCIGRKFAMVEAVCWLTMVLRDWRVEPMLRPGETEEMWRQRVLDARVGMTLNVFDVPVRLVRRRSK
ncbi:cytochrome P450 family protein [Pleurotus pulmonarius]